MKGNLYLIPSALGEEIQINRIIPVFNKRIINKINFYIVENERTARRTLIKIGIETKIDDLTFFVIDKHKPVNEQKHFLKPLFEGKDVGILSEAGCPAIADPGSELIRSAHENEINIIPLIGPSSIILGLMASGLNGQNFTFLGYLPIKSQERIKMIRNIERNSAKTGQTQIFIETPYRNLKLIEDILSTCSEDTYLCIAANLTMQDEFIKTMRIRDWKKNIPDINKQPAIFLMNSN